MRDDIHKSAPVPTPWKRVIRACGRDADWQREGERLAQLALISDLNRQIRPTFISNIQQAVDPDQRDLLANPSGLHALRAGKLTPIEEQIVEHAARLAAEGCRPDEIAGEAVEAVASARAESWRRACTGHLLKAGGAGAHDLVARLHKSTDSIPLRKISAEIAQQGKAATTGLEKPNLDLDEDLLGRR